MPSVLLFAIGENEMAIIEKAKNILMEFNIEAECISTSSDISMGQMDHTMNIINQCKAKVIIATAGEIQNLPSLIAARTTLPVLAIPVKSSLLNGLDSLMAAIKTSLGSTAPALAIDGGENAGLLAVQILAVHDTNLVEKIKAYRGSMKDHVENQNIRLKEALGG